MANSTTDLPVKKLPRFIAITGQEGSGKDSLGDYLVTIGYMHVSAGDFIRDRARELGHTDPISRTILSQVGDDMRKTFGPCPITSAALSNYAKVHDEFPAGLVISGLRRTSELETFKAHGAVSLWIDSEEELRLYRMNRRSRGDQQSRAEFAAKSKEEYYGVTQGGAAGVNLRAIEKLADCRIVNNSTLQDLYAHAAFTLSHLA